MPRHILKSTKQTEATIVVALNGLFDGDGSGAKWVQVTREGNFPGYLGGLKPFAFRRADLEAMVSNIKSHPAFAVGDDGVATGNVIPWDFNHASEANPTTGDLPVTGAPASGWTLDMEIRSNPIDGTAELWALTQFAEPARTYVKAGQYQWASVAVAFNAIHPETAQNIGAIVTSIALTNTPFVEGMERLAASRNGIPVETTTLGRTFFEAARDASDAISMMRDMFSLPETAGAAEVMAQVAIVQQWIASGTAPLGTNPENLIGNMRIILNLPALTSQAGVLEEASNSIQALLVEQAAAAGVPDASSISDRDGMVPPPIETMAAQRQKDMDDMDELLKVLASLLGVRENEASVKSAVTELAQLRESLQLAMGLSRDGVKVILDAAKEGVDAKTRLLALFDALGVEDPDAALQKVASTMEAAAKLSEVMPELTDLKAEKAETDQASAESDVDAAIAASKLNPSLKGALLLQRTSDPEGFAKDFPKDLTPATSQQHLLRSVATAGATPLKVSASVTAPATTVPGADPIAPSDTINLGIYPGRNSTARAMLHLAATRTNWGDLTHDQQFLAAVSLKKLPNVIDQVAV